MRRHKAIRLDDLNKIRCSLKKIKPFIVAHDYSPSGLADQEDILNWVKPPAQQLEMLL